MTAPDYKVHSFTNCWLGQVRSGIAAFQTHAGEAYCTGGDACGQMKAKVILFKYSGKYYTEEEWRVPTEEEARDFKTFTPGDMVTPYVMRFSPDWHQIGYGPVLVVTQEPWGFPHLIRS